MSNRGLGNKLLFELMPCARVAVATGRALVVRTERHIAEALGGVDFAAAPGEAPAIAWLAPGLADACPGSPGSCQSHELVCDRRRPAHLPALCGRRLGHRRVSVCVCAFDPRSEFVQKGRGRNLIGPRRSWGPLVIRERRARATRSNRRGESGPLSVPRLPSSSLAVRDSTWGEVRVTSSLEMP